VTVPPTVVDVGLTDTDVVVEATATVSDVVPVEPAKLPVGE
jgi:hypothetical protein